MSNDRLWQMEAFCAVVDAGGFAAAAQRLGVSQSSVSKAMRALEDRLGVNLLVRNTRGHTISLEGDRFLADCRKVLDLVEHVEDDVISARSDPSGQLKISAPVSFGLDQISPILPTFMSENPRLNVEFSVTDRVENVIDRQIDVAIRMGELEDSSLIRRKLCELDRIVVASPKYLRGRGIPQSPEELKSHNCLMWKGNAQHLNTWPFYESKRRSTIRVDGSFRSNNGNALIEACIDGVGVMRMAEHIAVPLTKSKKLVQVLQEFHRPDNHAIYVLYQREKRSLTKVRSFVDFCMDRFQLPDWKQV